MFRSWTKTASHLVCSASGPPLAPGLRHRLSSAPKDEHRKMRRTSRPVLASHSLSVFCQLLRHHDADQFGPGKTRALHVAPHWGVRWHVSRWHGTAAPATSLLRQIIEMIQTRQGYCRQDATAPIAVAGILGGSVPNQICVELPAKEGHSLVGPLASCKFVCPPPPRHSTYRMVRLACNALPGDATFRSRS